MSASLFNEDEINKMDNLISRAFLATVDHFERHMGKAGCEICELNQAILEFRKAKTEELNK